MIRWILSALLGGFVFGFVLSLAIQSLGAFYGVWRQFFVWNKELGGLLSPDILFAILVGLICALVAEVTFIIRYA